MDTAPPPAPAPEQRTLFTIVITSTPVLLAVIATFILGQSSSEMTKAQYQRSLAGQKQSKVANQWDFFQAKRIRGTTLEAASTALFAQKAELFHPDTLLTAAKELIREIQQTRKEVPKLREPLQTLEKDAVTALEQATALLAPPSESVKSALDALETYPKAKKEKSVNLDAELGAEEHKLLEEILLDVRTFKPDKEIAPKALVIKTATIDRAMEIAKAEGAKINERGKTIDRTLEKIDALVDGHAALARKYQGHMARYVESIKTTGDVEEIKKQVERLESQRMMSTNVYVDYKAARFAFDAHRYEDDARVNQEQAYLYDIYVLQSSARSDRHLGRSFGFMMAMLAAQVGVTIGTLALAMRWRMPAWMIAVLAGMSAIALGVYVFLELGPLNW